MRIRITHSTEYAFTSPVYLEPHIVRLRPRPGAGYNTESHQMRCEPESIHASQILDIGGGRAALLTLNGPTDILHVETVDVIQFFEYDPFDFIVYPGEALSVDGLAAYATRPELRPFTNRDARTAKVDALAQEMIAAAGGEILAFLTQVSTYLNREIAYGVRETGDAQSPLDTLNSRKGACRDFAVLYMDICRAAGIPARFVSGYHADTESDDAVHMHAWVEVFIPGAGWRGFDPTNGIAATNRYVATAAAALPEDAAPVSGNFRGDGATTEMSTAVSMEEVD